MFKTLKNTLAILSLSLLLTACAASKANYNAEKMIAIKTIAVAVPAKTNYVAATPTGLSLMGGAAGFVADSIASINGAERTKKMASFNDLVTAKLGDTGLNRKFTDAIEAELRAQGYVVTEVDLAKENMPKVVYDKDRNWSLQGPSYSGADAILVVQLTTAYFAPGTLYAFNRQVIGSIKIFKSDTLEPEFQESLFFKTMTEPYSYSTFAGLVKDLPNCD